MAETSKQIDGFQSLTCKGRDNTFFEVVEQLMGEVKIAYQENSKLSDDILAALNCVFQSTLVPALDLVDNKSVTMVTCPAGRNIFQVLGSSGTPYSCFMTSQYCCCPAYKFSVNRKQEHSMCKHALAARLSQAMGICKTLEVSDQELANMISQID